MDARHSGRAVVVWVDGSVEALRAVRWAATEAEHRRTPLRLVNAFAWPLEGVGRSDRGRHYRESLLDQARSTVAGAAAIVQQEVPGLPVEQQVVVGSPIDVLGAEARHAQLLVLGSRGESRIEGLLAGSVAVALTAHAACPVVVVRGRELSAEQAAGLPVVVGVDGSPVSEAAIGFAYEAASRRRAPLVAVHTWRDVSIDPALAAVLYVDDVETGERELLAERLAGWTEKYPDVSVQRVVVPDRPARRLLEQAAMAQLVVVGSRGRGELAGFALGSVSNTLVHKSDCPVAVVRAEEA